MLSFSDQNPFSLDLFEGDLSSDQIATLAGSALAYFNKPAFNNSTQMAADALVTGAATTVQKHTYDAADSNPDFYAEKLLRPDGTSTFIIYDEVVAQKLVLGFNDAHKPTIVTDIDIEPIEESDIFNSLLIRYQQSALAFYAPDADIEGLVQNRSVAKSSKKAKKNDIN